jgi:hypothetical protein
MRCQPGCAEDTATMKTERRQTEQPNTTSAAARSSVQPACTQRPACMHTFQVVTVLLLIICTKCSASRQSQLDQGSPRTPNPHKHTALVKIALLLMP